MGGKELLPHEQRVVEEQKELDVKFKARKLVIGRTQPGDRLVLCDEETGQPLEGQTDLKLNSPSNGCPTVTVTFEVWGPHGVRFVSDPRPEH